MGINGYMIAGLLMERRRANNMPPEKKQLYDAGEFDERGFSKVQFMKFFKHGSRKVFDKEMISRENRVIDKLYFIVDGNAHVTSKDGRKLATIPPHRFIGEMAFLVNHQNKQKDEEAPLVKASANVMVDGLVHAWEWDARDLSLILREDRELSNAFASYCSHDLREKLLSSNAEGGAIIINAKSS